MATWMGEGTSDASYGRLISYKKIFIIKLWTSDYLGLMFENRRILNLFISVT